jgi:hypothetical protein
LKKLVLILNPTMGPRARAAAAGRSSSEDEDGDFRGSDWEISIYVQANAKGAAGYWPGKKFAFFESSLGKSLLGDLQRKLANDKGTFGDQDVSRLNYNVMIWHA